MKNFKRLKNKKILLVGGGGFIGHNLALKLKNYHIDVTVVDNFQVNNFAHVIGSDIKRLYYIDFLVDRIKLLKENKINVKVLDARNYHEFSKVIEECGNFDVVVHLAAVSHANRSNKDPFSTFDHSLRTLENSLDICRGTNAHFIYLSSSMVYGDFYKERMTEDSTLNPKGIYGNLKVQGELLSISYSQQFDIPITIIRPSALYGPRCISGRVLQSFIEKIFAGEKLTINGDGTDKLDFTYIDDFVSGVCCCALNKNAYGNTYNITYGESRSLNDVIAILNQYLYNHLVVKDSQIEYKKRDKSMPFRGTLDISKARKEIGYNPKKSLEVGLRKYIKWYRRSVFNGN